MRGFYACVFVLCAAASISYGKNVKCGKGTTTESVDLMEGDKFTFGPEGKKYSSNMDCLAYYFMGSCSKATVTCKKFNLKSNKKCTRGDVLYIYDKDFNDEAFCRKKAPKGTEMEEDFGLHFMSDGRKNGRSFTCTVECVAGGGNGPTVAPTVAPTQPPVTGPTTTSGPVVTSPPGECKCGLANRATRIVGGTITEVSEYPWQAGLVSKGGSTPFCGGSVIGDRWILTAAHCTTSSASSMQVLLGEHDTKSSSETKVVRKNVKRIIDHPSYNSNSLDYDFALLELDSAVDFASNSHIRPACLPTGSDSYAGLKAIVTGWGTTSSGGNLSSKLREVTVDVLTNKQCKASSYGNSDITSRMLCAAVNGGGKDACQGDSGGPLVSSGTGDGVTPGNNYELIGVVSWGNGCALANYPGVYSRVTEAITWIESNTSGSFNTCPRT